MSAVLFGFGRESEASQRSSIVGAERSIERASGFSAERFADGQVRGLVRQVFTSGLTPPVRQVVFTGIEAGVDVGAICARVGETLAAETAQEVVVVTSGPRSDFRREAQAIEAVRTATRQVDKNLWSLQIPNDGNQITSQLLRAYMLEIRREFEYSILGASAGEPNEALAMGQSADGIILVLSAMRTRRAVALRFRDGLAQSRLLGTVLTDREFPIPAAIYRRL